MLCTNRSAQIGYKVAFSLCHPYLLGDLSLHVGRVIGNALFEKLEKLESP